MATTKQAGDPRLDVSIVMPCLNEALSLEVCIGWAQEALGVSARPECRINQYGAGAIGAAPGQCGAQQFDAAVEQDRDVSVVGARIHGRLSGERVRCTVVSVRAQGPGVGEVRQGRLGQRPRDTVLLTPIR